MRALSRKPARPSCISNNPTLSCWIIFRNVYEHTMRAGCFCEWARSGQTAAPPMESIEYTPAAPSDIIERSQICVNEICNGRKRTV